MPSRRTFLIVSLLFVLNASRAATSYTIVDLGSFFPGDSVQADGINNNGVVVGTDGTRETGFYWDGSLHALPSLPVDSSSGPTAINNNGWITGQSFTSENQNGVIWINGTPARLPVPSNFVYPDGINSSGSVVGTYRSGNITRAFLVPYGAGSATLLGTLGGSTSQAYAINDAGVVVGSADTANGNSRAFTWSSGHMTQLSDLGLSSAAYCLNQQGTIGGWVLRSDFTRQPVLWGPDGTRVTLPGLAGFADAEVWGINQNGLAVGDADGTAVEWSNGGIQSLLSLVGPNSGWRSLNEAYGVNDSGEIVGWGTQFDTGTQQHAYLLIPVPEPILPAIVVMIVCIFGARRFVQDLRRTNPRLRISLCRVGVVRV